MNVGNGKAAHPREAYGLSEKTISNGSQSVTEKASRIKARSDIWAVAALVSVALPEKTGVKFPSPFRPDAHPSCELWRTSDGDVLIRDRSTGETFDSIKLYAHVRGITDGKAIAELANRYNASASARVSPQRKVESKEAVRKTWPAFVPVSQKDWNVLSDRRSVSTESLTMLAVRGLLWVAEFAEGRAWVVTDKTRRNAQARLLSGSTWPETPRRGETKALTLWGSDASWPIGIMEAQNYSAIALCEGGPDFVSVLHHALCEGTESIVAPVMMAGATQRIHEDALPLFAGRRIRIFIHDDTGGNKAAFRWAVQLQSVGCHVDGFDFAGLMRDDGKPVKDLNDLCRIDVDSWEAHRDIVENSMSLALPGGN